MIALVLFSVASCNKTEQKNALKGNLSRLLDKAQNAELNDTIRKKYIDTLYTELTGKENDSLTRYFYARTTLEYYTLDFYDESLRSGRKGLGLTKKANDTLNMARIMYCMGGTFYGMSENDSAYFYYAQAEKMYQKLNNQNMLGEIILYKAYIYYSIGEYALCESEAIRALRLLTSVDGTALHVYNCYNLIGTALDGLNNNEEAIKYFELALKQLEQLKREGYSDTAITMNRISCYNNMGGVYEKMDQPGKAIELYDEVLKETDLMKNSPALYAKLLNNKAYAQFKSRDMSNLPDLFFQSLKIRDSLNNKSGIVASNIHLGEFYAFKHDTTRAIGYLKTAYQEAQKIKSHNEVLKALDFLSDVDKPNADFYQKKYIEVNDHLQKVAEGNRDKFARIEYETEKVRWENEELVKRNSFIIGISGVVVLLLGAIFVIYYLNSRNKKLLLIQEQQNANEEIYQLMLEQQTKIDKARDEEKSRIAMELHDGILNNIYAVRLNLEFINKKADEESVTRRKDYIKQLQKVETEIRGVSHDLSRNAIFQDKDFRDLLESVIISQRNTFGTTFDADIDPDIIWDDMPNIRKVNLYRIIQEGLQNINKYSKAENAKVVIKKEYNTVHLTITDDGVGFNPDKAKGGIGMKNLKKRAAALNGYINIFSAPRKGSRIEVVFPN